MKPIIYFAILFFIITLNGMANKNRHEYVMTAIDNGCNKPAKLEIKPAVYNTWPNNQGVM